MVHSVKFEFQIKNYYYYYYYFYYLSVPMIVLNVFILKNYLASLATVSPGLTSLMSNLIAF